MNLERYGETTLLHSGKRTTDNDSVETFKVTGDGWPSNTSNGIQNVDSYEPNQKTHSSKNSAFLHSSLKMRHSPL